MKMIERETGCRVKVLRSDNGGEYIAMEDFCRARGIRHQFTLSYSPQPNGVAKRKNRTIQDQARAFLHQSRAGVRLWIEAVATANHFNKWQLTSRSIDTTPEELWKGRKPSIAYLCV